MFVSPLHGSQRTEHQVKLEGGVLGGISAPEEVARVSVAVYR